MSTLDDMLPRLDADEGELLALEYDLPHADGDLDERADSEHERYDEQILAALVAPSF